MPPETESEWRRVTRQHPCPCCGKASWCAVKEGAVYCMRSNYHGGRAGRPVEAGGWIHNLQAELPEPAKQVRKLTAGEVQRLVQACYRHSRAEQERQAIAVRLGVDPLVLRALRVGCGLDEHRGQLFTSWPERESSGRFSGLVRRYEDGSKKTYPGTSHGLIYTDGLRRQLRTAKAVFLPEGGSDTAALLSLGLVAIGRPSNLGGVRQLSRLLHGYRASVVVLGENDRKNSAACGVCGACGLCWPGRFGATETASRLASREFKAYWAILPGSKDVRAWVQARPRVTAEQFLAAVRDCIQQVNQ